MAITFVDETTADVLGGAGTTTVSLPTTLEGDIWVATISCSANLSTAPDGIVGQGWTTLDRPNSSFPGSQLAYKVMSSTPDTEVIIDREASIQSACVFQAWRGVDPISPIDVSFASAEGNDDSPNPPSRTTNTAGALFIIAFSMEDENLVSVTAPSGYTNLIFNGVGTAAATAAMASKIIASPALEDPGVFTCNLGDAWRAYSFALRPLAAETLLPLIGEFGGPILHRRPTRMIGY